VEVDPHLEGMLLDVEFVVAVLRIEPRQSDY